MMNQGKCASSIQITRCDTSVLVEAKHGAFIRTKTPIKGFINSGGVIIDAIFSEQTNGHFRYRNALC
jgi:hypothetical protein